MNRTSAKIKELRLSRGITQQQLAEKVGLSWTVVANAEQSRRLPPFGHLKLFAAFFEIEVNILTDLYMMDLRDRKLTRYDLITR